MSRLLNRACSPAGGVEKTCDFLPPRKLVSSTPWLRPECPYCPTVAIPSRQSIIILSSLGLFFLPESRLARAELSIRELSVVVGEPVNLSRDQREQKPPWRNDLQIILTTRTMGTSSGFAFRRVRVDELDCVL